MTDLLNRRNRQNRRSRRPSEARTINPRETCLDRPRVDDAGTGVTLEPPVPVGGCHSRNPKPPRSALPTRPLTSSLPAGPRTRARTRDADGLPHARYRPRPEGTLLSTRLRRRLPGVIPVLNCTAPDPKGRNPCGWAAPGALSRFTYGFFGHRPHAPIAWSTVTSVRQARQRASESHTGLG